ncbi:MAG: hypothetical protein ACKVS8_05310 [Phycisphaerales bacterium]
MSEQPHIHTAPPRLTRSPVVLSDFTDHLVWPQLLRAGGLALAPHRIGLCAAALVVIFLVDQAWHALLGHPAAPPNAPAGAVATPQGPIAVLAANLLQLAFALLLSIRDLNPQTFAQAVGDLFLGLPLASTQDAGRTTAAGIASVLVLVPLALAVLGVCGAAVSRSAACQFSLGKAPAWPQALGFALSRWRSLLGAVLGPLVVVWLLLAATAGIGRALFAYPVANVLGAILLPIALVACLVAALLCAAYAFGHVLLVPAVAADDADAFDAVQRAYAYTLAKPFRLVGYLALLVAQGLVAALLVRAIMLLTMGLASITTGAPFEAGASVLQSADADVWLRTTARIVDFWAGLVSLLAVSYIVSFYFTASTLLYLAMRRVCDHQDMAEVWMPRQASQP